MGNNVWHAPSYNSRLQMSGFIDSVGSTVNVNENSTSNVNELLNVSLTWTPHNSSNNNGNLWAATYNNGVPGSPAFLTFNQTFNYDGVNRLVVA